ncbi:tRNA (guanosine(37)-N1)-methyltransferase TrmD [Ferrimicrobium sp.]|uniref:tRNA (guanosine(37)-N1)-methyltransferase TrmD n=1 Tax=Ferrimicrobium sp. TaxID=2926050 RepID=UPI00261EE4CB|nr:tRNA (guanosine(37)-N1)-methyltransferase TrmD [Ferrimicrobium sp.]
MTLRVTVVTIFPQLIEQYLDASVLGRATQRSLLEVTVLDLRSYTDDPRRSIDDAPYGGGPGMLMMPEPVLRALADPRVVRPTIGLSPAGATFRQADALELSQADGFTLICGRYEGFDARIEDACDRLISIGDFVLAGGELAALMIIEATARLFTGVLGNEESAREESFALDQLLEYPQYTRPRVLDGHEVPEVLLSGNHEEVNRWRYAQRLVRTLQRRPDLIDARGGISPQEVELLHRYGYDELLQTMNKERLER